eukprot:TRINITY_DN4774_c0_g1_i6.p1 TRINITY_DN4774_c0_g1~~TRINITY_DN4774_c0_g1_i6.p1  ORF type:complete len:110 (+),score=15.10 TRINITY_DN4774_c0_g1_i6:700-1029(+)
MEASRAGWVHASISRSFSTALFSSMSTVFSIFCNAIRAASLSLCRCIFNSASACIRAEASAALSCASILALSVQIWKRKKGHGHHFCWTVSMRPNDLPIHGILKTTSQC